MPYGNNQNTGKIKGWNVKETVKRQETDPQSRIDLNPQDFDRLIKQKGTRLKVYRTSYCPNVKSVDGAEHQIDCPLCNGSGYLDVYPICTWGFIQTQELEKMYESGDGYHDGNTVSITFLTGIELQYFTKVELEDYTQLYYQRVLRNATPVTIPPTSPVNVDVLKYKACRVNLIIDQNNVEYFQDQDYRLDPNGNILWDPNLSGRKPADNVIYTIHYECHASFRTVKAIHVNRFTQFRNTDVPNPQDTITQAQVTNNTPIATPDTPYNIEQLKMPEQWMCTKEFLLRRRDINTNADLVEGPFDNHINQTNINDGIDD